jgi:hypothetical protein
MTLSSINTIYSVDGSCNNVTPALSIKGNWQGKSDVLRGKNVPVTFHVTSTGCVSESSDFVTLFFSGSATLF